ncbi:hypothetical protein ACWEQ4_01500 [Rhodococcus sp. NPDC003994]
MKTQRKYERTNNDIWTDEDFRALPPAAQHLYFVLSTDPTMTQTGVADWRPARIALKSAGWTPAAVCDAARILAERLFIVVDEESEEVLLRSKIKHDAVLVNPNSAVGMCNKVPMIASTTLVGVVVFELRKLRVKYPDLPGWTSANSASRLAELLDRTAVDPATFPTGYPSALGLLQPHSGLFGTPPSGHVQPVPAGVSGAFETPAETPPGALSEPSGNPSETPPVTPSRPLSEPSGNPSVSPPGTPPVTPPGALPVPLPEPSGNPSETPLPINQVPKNQEITTKRTPHVPPADRQRRKTRIAPDYLPAVETRRKIAAEFPHLNLEVEHRNFVDWWLGDGGSKLDWDATWRNWMRRNGADPRRRGGSSQPAGNGLTSTEMKLARAEALKANPNPEILRRAGLPVPPHVERRQGELGFGDEQTALGA